MSNVKTVMLEDGDDLLVMVRIKQPSMWDPAALYGSIMRMYRVTGLKSSESILELTPLGEPGLATKADTFRKEEEEMLDKL
jgi:hypothetical protein